MSPLKADLLLASATIFWGTTFIISKLLFNKIPVTDYITIRFIVASLIMIIIMFVKKERLNKQLLLNGTVTGLILYGMFALQMNGLKTTSASNTGFITGSYVIFVPILALLINKNRMKINSTIGTLLALTGLFFISEFNFIKINIGDILVFASSFLVALHIIFTNKYSQKNSPYAFTTVTICTVAIISTFVSLFNGFSPESFKPYPIFVLLYLAIFGTAYAFTIQSAVQKYTTATRTALIFTLEPVFAAIFAVLIGGETININTIIGGSLIFMALIVSDINWKNYLKK